MHDIPLKVLWTYIILLIIGGMIGYYKAKSHISLYMSVGFAIVLALCALNVIFQPYVADFVLMALLVVFAIRWVKTKKMMPAGVMLILTVVTLALRHINFG